MVKEAEIAATLAEAESLSAGVAKLVERANEAGGRDNITVVAFCLEQTDAVALDDGATLIGPSAEEAGLSSERIRAAAARRASGERAAEPPRRNRLRTAAKVLAVLVIVAGLGAAAVWGARQVYFLGIDEGGRVALYRGLPYELPFGINLYSEVSSEPFQAASVPDERQDEITDHELRGRDDAESLIESLQDDVVAPLPLPPPGGTEPSGGNGEQGSGQGGRANEKPGAANRNRGGNQGGNQGGGSQRDQDERG
jgi:protein phosphatase